MRGSTLTQACIYIAVLVGIAQTADIRIPRFEDYRTTDIFHGKPAPKIVLVAAKFRSVIAGGRFVKKPFPWGRPWVHNQVA